MNLSRDLKGSIKGKKKWCTYNKSSLVRQSSDRSSISDKSIHSLAARLIVH